MRKEHFKKLAQKLTDTKLKKIIVSVFCLFLFIYVIFALMGINIIVKAYSYLTDFMRGNIQEVKTVEIKSNGYDEALAGSYMVEKHAEWISSNTLNYTLELSSNIEFQGKKQDLIIVYDTSMPENGKGVCNIDNKKALSQLSKDIIENSGSVSLISLAKNSDLIVENSNDYIYVANSLESLSCEIKNEHEMEYNNYYKALRKLEDVLEKNSLSENTNVLFIVDGYSNKDNTNIDVQLNIIRRKFPKLNIVGIQYNLGSEINNILQVYFKM